MRELEDGQEIRWSRSMHRRLTLDFDSMGQGERTREAEDGLGLGENAYFYVERSSPAFGDCVILYRADGLPDEHALVSPFDTGGLWHGEAYRGEMLTPEDKRALVQEYSFALSGYEEHFVAWVDECYSSIGEYRQGIEPTRHAVEGYAVPDSDDRQWTWEVRLRKRRGIYTHLAVERGYLMDGRRATYVSWMREEKILTGEQRRKYLQWLAEHVTDVGTPVVAMRTHLDTVDEDGRR